jgi:hypothetical protein
MILPEAGLAGKAWFEPDLELLQNASKSSEITYGEIASVAEILTSGQEDGLRTMELKKTAPPGTRQSGGELNKFYLPLLSIIQREP